MKKIAWIVLILAVIMTFGSIYFLNKADINFNKKKTGKVDDWIYSPEKAQINKSYLNSSPSFEIDTAVSESTNLGFSTGGAQNINNFRENIENGYFPLITDITYNGIFSEYYFDTSNEKVPENNDDLFYPTYSSAISKDPLTGEEEYYLSVGLNSNIKEEDFKRKNLNLVLVLDISGSMDSGFNNYYYDLNDLSEQKSKIQIAKESINMLIDRLGPNDSLGIVLFESDSTVAKKLNLNSNTDLDAIKSHVLEIVATGGTNFENGYEDATELFEEYELANNNNYENRIIILTDAMPNTGELSEDGLLGMIKENANNKIYTTFIGIGVDFNTELIENIGDVRGSNYYSVHSEDEFNAKMDEEFEYMVTPLVFDLKLELESNDFEIAEVFGSDTKNKNEIMNVNTLFPSKTENGETKGGIVLLKLNKLNDNSETLKLKVTYTDRNGETYFNEQDVKIDKSEGEYYDNIGIRKGIVLSRYVTTMKKWIAYERTLDDRFIITVRDGIELFDEELYTSISKHERVSVELSASDEFRNIFEKLKEYVQIENEQIKDENLNSEIELLEKLINL